MGKPEKDMTLDRINNNKGYYKENCRWATRKVQAINQRVRKDTCIINGKHISFWVKEYGINYQTLYGRIRKGVSFNEAIKI